MATLKKDVINLIILKIFQIGYPLIVIGVTSRILSESDFSIYVLISSTLIFLNVFVEYGFNISGIKDIVNLDKNSANNKIRKILISKFILASITAIIFIISNNLWGIIKLTLLGELLLFLLIFVEVYNPNWWMHGKGKIVESVKYEIIIFTFSIISIIIMYLIGSKNFYFYLLLPFIVKTCVWIYVTNKFNLKILKNISIKGVKKEISEGFQIFSLRLISAIYTRSSAIILSSTSTDIDLISFVNAEKITKASNGLNSPLSQSFYPRIVNDVKKMKNYGDLNFKNIYMYFFFGTISSILIIFSIDVFGLFFLKAMIPMYYIKVNDVLEILKYMILPMFLSNFFGMHILISLEKKTLFNLVLIINSTFFLIGLFFLKGIIDAKNLSLLLLSVESIGAILLTISGLYYLMKLKNKVKDK